MEEKTLTARGQTCTAIIDDETVTVRVPAGMSRKQWSYFKFTDAELSKRLGFEVVFVDQTTNEDIYMRG